MGWFRKLGKANDAPKLTAIEQACADKGIDLNKLIKKSKVSENTVNNVMDAKIPTGTLNKLEKVLGKGSLSSASK